MKTEIETSKARPLDASFKAWLDADGKPFLMGAVHASHECGCKVIGNATLPDPLDLKLCEHHQNAIREYDALKAVAEAAKLILQIPEPMTSTDHFDYSENSTRLLKSALAALEAVRNQ